MKINCRSISHPIFLSIIHHFKKKEMRSILKKIGVLLPSFLLTLSALIYEYSIKSYIFVSPTILSRPLVFLWAILLILTWFIHKITKNWNWTGIALFVFVIAFYLPESMFYLASTLIITILFIWLFASIVLKKKLKTKPIKYFQLGISIILLSIPLYRLVPSFFTMNWLLYNNSLPEITNALPLPKKTPDIYFIILDAYGDTEILQKYYGYDNAEFITYLKETGFIVPEKVYSNYAKTSVSIPATLNLDYIQNIAPDVKSSVFWWLMQPFTQESQVHLLLKQANYQSVSIATDWDITNNTKSDFYFSPYQFHLSQFEGSYLANTPLKILTPFLNKVAFVPSFRSHHNLLQYNFDTLENIPQLSGPKFVFAHIIAPHPPFVIDKHGNHIEPSYGFTFNDANDFPSTNKDYITGYLNKLEYTNTELKKVIEVIISQSKIPPIILIQADHGPGLLTDFSSSKNTCLEERFSIFAAYYLPNLDHNPIPKEFTPVNLFRIIFNEYFSTDFPLLENKSYFQTDAIKIYGMEDITTLLENPSKDMGCSQIP